MYPKSDNRKNQKSNDRPNNQIREEIKADSEIGYGSSIHIGNQGMIDLLGGPSDEENHGGDENNNSIISDDESNNNIIDTRININKKNKPDRAQADKIREQEEEIINEKDPVKALEKAPVPLLDELMYDLEDENPELDKSMVVEAPKRKKIQNKKNQDDLEDADDDLKPAEGFNFRAVKIPKRDKPGGGRRFLGKLGWYSGKTLGKLLGLVLNAVYWPVIFPPVWLTKKLFGLGKNRRRVDPEEFQEKRRHDKIQGWDGRKYQEQIPGERMADDPIEVDFRKIPGVWAQLTAGKAEDNNHKPLKPVITVYVSEPKEMTDDVSELSDIGHTFIGLEFSHFSKVTNRFERYITKYGLFAPGGNAISAYIAGHYYDATLPAQLLNDADYGYRISQSFPAEPKQVNDIMKASETYADKGYRLYDRNCTTFVKEMVVDVAHIKAAEHILAPEEIRLSHGINFGSFLSAGFSMNARLGMSHIFGEMGAQDDMSYERIGNKRATKEEYDRYQKTKNKGGSWQKFGMTPNSAAENMRRVKSSEPELINSLYYFSKDKEKSGVSIQDVIRAYDEAAVDVNTKIREITPEELLDVEKVPEEFGRIFSELMAMASPLSDIIEKINEEDDRNNRAHGSRSPEEYESITPALLQEKRSELMNNISDLNKLLFKYFQNDKRLHLKFIKLFGILNRGVDMIDDIYRDKKKGRQNAGDLGDVREKFSTDRYLVKAGGLEETFTGSHYESYLQIFKKPEQAIEKYSRYKDLKSRDLNDEHLSKDEKAELAKLERLEKLADEYDNAHNYMLDKEGYRQQDIDYAFSLSAKERDNNASGEMFNKSMNASNVYKAIILEKIFGGMRERIMKDPEEGGISEKDSMVPGQVMEWLDRDMSTKAEAKMNGFRMVLLALKRSLKNPDREQLYEAVQTMFINSWFPHVFPQTGNGKLNNVGIVAPAAIGVLWMDRNKKFPQLVLKLIDKVLNEGKDHLLLIQND